LLLQVFRLPGIPSTKTRGEVDAIIVEIPRNWIAVPAVGTLGT
ncbi:MAG: hypothetical protein JWQ28_2334, partial [Pedobacter sp.]|nr:hypothetical protein [Pedobacter sp.]